MQVSSNIEAFSMSELHRCAVQVSSTRVQAEWELAHLLLEMDKRRAWRELGCASVVEYGEQHLALGVHQTLALLQLAQDLRLDDGRAK